MDTSPYNKTVESAKVVPLRVGEKIRALRTKLGLTQAQLAAPEFSVSYISAIERGKIRPAVRALYFISKRLDVRSERRNVPLLWSEAGAIRGRPRERVLRLVAAANARIVSDKRRCHEMKGGHQRGKS